MILSRISKAVREQNWFAVALEFFIVVSGVLLAFQISQLSAQRAVNGRIEAQIALIEAEMRNDLRWIQSNVGVLETNNTSLRQLRVALGEYSPDMDPAELNALAIFAFSNPTLEVEHYALDRLEIMEGRQSLSGSPLETALRNWRQILESVRDTEQNIDDLIAATDTGSEFPALSTSAMVDQFPDIGLVDPIPSRFESDWPALSQDKAFEDYLALLALNLEFLWLRNRQLEQASQDVLDVIEARRDR